ncbi:MAG: TetR family transcriptional regulator [Frankiales bacterium]|nr:TetR family transcriptional regulator [Frankiales bacterium]
MVTTAGQAPERPLRADAERNRQRILEVAQEVFAEQGLDAGFDEIARRAGLGVGTVYRRFPDRDGLVEALFEQRLTDIVALARAGCAEPEPWAAFCHFVERTLAMQVADRGLKELLACDDHDSPLMVRARDRLTPAVSELVQRTKDGGGLRHDVEVNDVVALTTLLSPASTTEQPDLWRRYLTLVLDGMRASRTGITRLPLDAPDTPELGELMADSSARRSARR